MPKAFAKWNRPPSTITKRMAKYAKILEKEMSDAIGLATYTMRDTAKRHTHQARNIAASDSITGKARKTAGQSPVRTKVYRNENRGTVSAVNYYTYGRTKGISSLFTRFGRRQQLTRVGLVVDPANRGNYLQRKSALKGKKARLIRFDQDAGLKKWATRYKMIQHAKVYLDAEMAYQLVTRPALRKNTDKISKIYQHAFLVAGARL